MIIYKYCMKQYFDYNSKYYELDYNLFQKLIKNISTFPF